MGKPWGLIAVITILAIVVMLILLATVDRAAMDDRLYITVILAGVGATLLAYAALTVLLISRYDPSAVMGYLTRFFTYLYWLQAIIVLPMFLGIPRQSMPFWIWERNPGVHSDLDFVLSVYLYIIFYTQFIAITYYLLNLRYVRRECRWKQIIIMGISLWILITFGIFYKVIVRTLSELPDWILLVWIGVTCVLAIWWHALATSPSRELTDPLPAGEEF